MAPPLIHFIPYLLTYSVHLYVYLKRQCDGTLGVTWTRKDYALPEEGVLQVRENTPLTTPHCVHRCLCTDVHSGCHAVSCCSFDRLQVKYIATRYMLHVLRRGTYL